MNGQTPSEFGRWLVDARGRAGMTQQELSTASGVHINTIKKLEAGETQRPSAQVAAKLKATLGQESNADTAREGYDHHTRAFLDLVGAYLMRLPEEQRLERIFDLTRYLITGPVGKG